MDARLLVAELALNQLCLNAEQYKSLQMKFECYDGFRTWRIMRNLFSKFIQKDKNINNPDIDFTFINLSCNNLTAKNRKKKC